MKKKAPGSREGKKPFKRVTKKGGKVLTNRDPAKGGDLTKRAGHQEEGRAAAKGKKKKYAPSAGKGGQQASPSSEKKKRIVRRKKKGKKTATLKKDEFT